MSNMVKFQPDGRHTVTPRIVVRNPESLIKFLNAVFHAQGEFRAGLPAEMRIGDSVVMVSGDDGLRDPMPAFLYVYVDDTDSTYRRAIAADATSLEEPADMPYGDRRAMVRDAWGNTWQIATHKYDLSVAEIRSRLG
jgi:PhnB protein